MKLTGLQQSVVHIFTLLSITRLSEYLEERTFVAMIQPLWTLPCLCALRYWPGVIHDAWGTYALTAALLAYPYCREYIDLPSAGLFHHKG